MGQNVPSAVLPVVGCVHYSSILFLTEDLWLSFAYKSAMKCTHLSTMRPKKKPAPDEAGFWFQIPSLTLGMTGTSLEATDPYAFAFCLISAWAAARRAMGTRNGEQET